MLVVLCCAESHDINCLRRGVIPGKAIAEIETSKNPGSPSQWKFIQLQNSRHGVRLKLIASKPKKEKPPSMYSNTSMNGIGDMGCIGIGGVGSVVVGVN